ncbi:MAG TPA: tetratricopeptide repeat protein [Gemmataceae bacterium]|nr:tetratricopeptide repeat protein [Gemmataceae bacterium]
MNGRLITLALLALLPWSSQAQENTVGEKLVTLRVAPPERSPQAQMYEDIEVMRRLLNGKLHGFAAQEKDTLTAHAVWFNDNACVSCHQSVNQNQLLLDWLGSVQSPRPIQTTGGTPWLAPHRKHNLLRYHPSMWTSGLPARTLDTEGTYLKGQGVIFTLTLPPPQRDPRPEPPKPAPKPPSDWERTRSEVRQEKPQAEKADKPPKEPTLSEVVLKVLADNGKHFAHLGENESLTVAITFRASPPSTVGGSGTAMVDFDNDGWMDFYIINPLDPAGEGKPGPAQENKTQDKPGSENANHKKLSDLILLGELHLKQGKTDDAIRSLRQALELKPEGEQAVAANKSLAQALVTAQKYDEALSVLQRVAEQQKKKQAEAVPQAESKSPPRTSPLPSKLVITVSKQILDGVGSGKTSFDDFKKAASIVYVTFSEAKK